MNSSVWRIGVRSMLRSPFSRLTAIDCVQRTQRLGGKLTLGPAAAYYQSPSSSSKLRRVPAIAQLRLSLRRQSASRRRESSSHRAQKSPADAEATMTGVRYRSDDAGGKLWQRRTVNVYWAHARTAA